MSRVIYVNGQYCPAAQAHVHVEDRGFQFADAVYEVIEVMSGQLIDMDRHLERLVWSLRQLEIPPPKPARALAHVIGEVVRRNRVRDGLVYLQISRGQARRDFLIQQQSLLQPSLIISARATSRIASAAKAARGISVVTLRDPRWQRCDIKTVMLLPASLAKTNAAQTQTADEVWFVDDQGMVVEGGSSTAWIVDADGRLRTRPLSHDLLPGVTRATAKDVAAELGIPVHEDQFSVDDALGAREAFITAASTVIMPVVQINGTAIADGQPGQVTLRLRASFHDVAVRSDRAPLGLHQSDRPVGSSFFAHANKTT